jgi:hypothetical protein
MMHNYIYEEFHPNHENDIKTNCEDFIESLLTKNIGLSPVFLSMTEMINLNDGVIKEADAIKKMEAFREAFCSFELVKFKISSLNMSDDKTEVSFDLSYTGIIEGTNEMKAFSGPGNFGLIYEYNYWCINKINIPGISV